MRTVHKVCTMLRMHEAALRDYDKPIPCHECPRTIKIEGHKGTQACRYQAEQMANIVKFGNPWGANHSPNWPKVARTQTEK